jgi:antitoxin MazE
MITKVVKIGNSRGIRIPKSLINQSGLTEEVELELGNGQIIIKSISRNRENWDTAFKQMAIHKDDVLMEPKTQYNASSWDKEEWEW